MRTVWAFVLRDFRVAWSYRFTFVVQNAGLVVSLASLKLTSRLFSEGQLGALSPYGGDYFSFALLGVGISLIGYPIVKTFAEAVRGAQMNGTLEAMLSTRARPEVIVLGGGVFALLNALLQLVVLLAAGAFILGAHLRLADLGLVIVILALTVASLAGIGLLAAAFALAFRQREPFTGALLAGSLLLGGVLYPVSVLPGWLRPLAPLLPITHSIALARALLIRGAHGEAIGPHLAVLAGFSLLFPVGLVFLSIALNWVRRTGGLAYY